MRELGHNDPDRARTKKQVDMVTEVEKPIFMIDLVENIEVDGVDTSDYPDFCDAYFSHAVWKETGIELTDDELEKLGDEYPCVLNAMAFEHYL